VAAIEAAVEHARGHGATIVEAYPVEPKQSTGEGAKMPAAFAWTGLLSAYLAAGFREVARRSATRPIVRRRLASKRRRPKTATKRT
jgi:hypothetical protein